MNVHFQIKNGSINHCFFLSRQSLLLRNEDNTRYEWKKRTKFKAFEFFFLAYEVELRFFSIHFRLEPRMFFNSYGKFLCWIPVK